MEEEKVLASHLLAACFCISMMTWGSGRKSTQMSREHHTSPPPPVFSFRALSEASVKSLMWSARRQEPGVECERMARSKALARAESK